MTAPVDKPPRIHLIHRAKALPASGSRPAVSKSKAAPEVRQHLARSLTPSLTPSEKKAAHMLDPYPPAPPLTPIQQLPLIQSVLGHVTIADAEDRIEGALQSVRRILDGEDPLAGEG